MLVATARIYRFPDLNESRNHWTIRDKLDLHGAGQQVNDAGFRCVIGRDTVSPCHDFLQLVPDGEALPAWTFVREGTAVRVWRGTCGADLGEFTTLAEALSAALRTATTRRRKSAGH